MKHVKLFERFQDQDDQAFMNQVSTELESKNTVEGVRFLLSLEFSDRELKNNHPDRYEFIKKLLNELTPQLTQDDIDSLNFTERMYLRNTIQRMNEPTEASEEDKIAELLGRFKMGEISQEEAIEKIKLGFKRTTHIY
jgi:hypothetical protein